MLQPGMRAMAITVNPGGEVAGFVFPGDRVDVILGHTVNRKDDPQLTDRHMSETVLTNVRVLALDQKTDDQSTDPKIAQLATLEVTPQDAERLALSAQLGTLSLSLRSLTVSDTLNWLLPRRTSFWPPKPFRQAARPGTATSARHSPRPAVTTAFSRKFKSCAARTRPKPLSNGINKGSS